MDSAPSWRTCPLKRGTSAFPPRFGAARNPSPRASTSNSIYTTIGASSSEASEVSSLPDGPRRRWSAPCWPTGFCSPGWSLAGWEAHGWKPRVGYLLLAAFAVARLYAAEYPVLDVQKIPLPVNRRARSLPSRCAKPCPGNRLRCSGGWSGHGRGGRCPRRSPPRTLHVLHRGNRLGRRPATSGGVSALDENRSLNSRAVPDRTCGSEAPFGTGSEAAAHSLARPPRRKI